MKKIAHSLLGVLTLFMSFFSNAQDTVSIELINGTDVIDHSKDSMVFFSLHAGSYSLEEVTITSADRTEVEIKLLPNNTVATNAKYPINVPVSGTDIIVKVFKADTFELLLSKRFRVNKSPGLDSNFSADDISGTWFMPEMPGMGFIAFQAPNGNIIQFYGYSTAGKRLWLVTDVNPTMWEKGVAQKLVVYEGAPDNGANFNTKANPVNGNVSGMHEWGTLEVVFHSCDKATATLNGLDGVQTYELIKLANLKNILCTSEL